LVESDNPADKTYEEKLLFVLVTISQYASILIHLVTILEILFARQQQNQKIQSRNVENINHSVDPFELILTDDENNIDNGESYNLRKRKYPGSTVKFTPIKKIRINE